MRMPCDVYFADEIRRQTDTAGAAQVLAESATALGWHLAAFHPDIHRPTLPRARNGEFIGTAMGWRAQTVNDWVDLGLARSCPIGRRCGEVTEPFLWDVESGCVDEGRAPLTPQEQAVLRHYSNDVHGGVTVPVRRSSTTGYVSWCSRERGTLRRSYHTTLSAVYLLSHTFLRQLDRLSGAQDSHGEGKCPLTARELECLTWAARGHTTDEIACLLHRSAETVNFHITNALAKLRARNRAHAVAIACTRGMIREL